MTNATSSPTNPSRKAATAPSCRQFSLGYLRHLHKLNDSLYQQLSTQHNLRFMARLMDLLRLYLP